MNFYYKKTQDQPVIYNGQQLPVENSGKLAPFLPDPTNNPSAVTINGVTLPSDVAIYVDAEKNIAESKILDGVSVFEHVSRKPYAVEFEFVLRTKNEPNTKTNKSPEYAFPQAAIQNLLDKVFIPNSILTVINTYLNGLGVSEIIISSITPTTVRGSKNLPVRIKGFENQKGQSIII